MSMGDRSFPSHSFDTSSSRYSSYESQSSRYPYISNVKQNEPEHVAPPKQPASQQTDQVQALAGWVLGLSSSVFAEHILSHPCIVLRRQCQVHHKSVWYHTTPFTLVPVIYNLERHQGITTLWKGILSVLLSKGILMVNETVISEVTPLPKEVSRHSPPRKHLEHLLLKVLSYIAATPFLASSVIETVQSDISSEKPGAFDFIKEGISRLMGWGMPQTTRLMPVYSLVLPTAFLGVSHYIIVQVARYTMMTTYRVEEQETRDKSTSVDGLESGKSVYDRFFPEMMANFAGYLLADISLYPLETVLHRLYLQGTRTIIDNTDTGTDVIPISTNYEGLFDCFRSIIVDEGLSGLYKGFGAVVLQYTIHAALLKISKFIFEKISQEFNPKKPTLTKPQRMSYN